MSVTRDMGEIRPVNGIMISYAAAEDLVGVIDMLAMLGKPRRLSSSIVRLRNELIQSCTYAKTYVNVSAEVEEPEDVLSFVQDAVIDPKTAAQRLGLTEAGVRWLCRKERLVAKQTDRRWWIDPDSVDLYAANRRAPATTPATETTERKH